MLHCLQKLTPIRGRKLLFKYFYKSLSGLFTEVNPDKGTKTLTSLIYCKSISSRLQKLTPIRGRKQITLPRPLYVANKCLQKLTPIRGRKRDCFSCRTDSYLFTEVNPDKGTKTLKLSIILLLLLVYRS